MTIAYPITRAWVSTGGTGAQNYDEFADDAEITAIVAANPTSALAVEMPHRTPESVAAGQSFREALPAAVRRLREWRASGRFHAVEQCVAVYRICAPDHPVPDDNEPDDTCYGLFCMVDTGQISTSAAEPGLVIRNEDVFVEKVRERTALADATGHLLSPVLLLQTAGGERLRRALRETSRRHGDPAVSDVDQQGRVHQIWPLGPSPEADNLLALAGGGELIVADGNHRTLAAQTGGLPRFLAVVTAPGSVVIRPYNRLLSELPLPAAEMLERLDAVPLPGRPGVPAASGTMHLYVAGRGYEVRLSAAPGGSVVERLDHSMVENLLFRDVLGLDPGDKRISYVGGDYPASWLCDEVDAGRAEMAVLIAAVTVDEFVSVNLARQKMPRKSTWFTPKARAGLVLADLKAEGVGVNASAGS